MKSKKDSLIRSASLGFLVSFDSLGHEWNLLSSGNALVMTKEEATAGARVLQEGGFNDVEIVPANSVSAVPGLKELNLAGIARVVSRDWRPVYFGAKPYLNAMASMDSVKDNFGNDSGREIVNYFLANASTWKGRIAREVKAELSKRVKARN